MRKILETIFGFPYRHITKYLSNNREDVVMSTSGFAQDAFRLIAMGIVGIQDNLYEVEWFGMSPLLFTFIISTPISALMISLVASKLSNEPKRFLKGQWWMILPYIFVLFPFGWFYSIYKDYRDGNDSSGPVLT